MDSRNIKSAITSKALELGFADLRFARAEFMDEEARRLEEWLGLGYHGTMNYMSNHFDKRVDPTKLVPGAKTVISLAYNYFTDIAPIHDGTPQLSIYAYGRDYHKVVRKKLKQLFQWIREEYGRIEGRFFVDSAPVLERDWARRSGLGWVGKNTLLINPRAGSFFFLAELIIDVEIHPDPPIKDYCGTCRKCIDACPTEAIGQDGYIMDGSKCISYLTIELKDDIPETFKGKMSNWMYGCDICQEVCPWNRFSKQHSEPQFLPKDELMSMTADDWSGLTEEGFDELFMGSAVKRTKYAGLKRNIDFLKNSPSDLSR
jgi:epoxyqueuosine reductase